LLKGTQNHILWGFAYEDIDKKLNWCTENLHDDTENKNKTIPVPLTVRGRKDGPFVLMSLPSKEPNLHAVDVVDAYNATKIFCFHFEQSKIEGNDGSEKNVQKNDNQSMIDSSLAMFENDFNANI
jgi:hypothetical protein